VGFRRSSRKRRSDESQQQDSGGGKTNKTESIDPEPRDGSLSFGLGMFRDHDVVVSLTRMTAVLIDASLRLVERFVAAESAAQPAPNNVVRPRVLPSLSFHDVHCARLRRSMSRRDSSGGTAVESTRPEDTSGGITKHSHVTGRVFIWPRELALTAHPSHRIGPGRAECAAARFTRIEGRVAGPRGRLLKPVGLGGRVGLDPLKRPTPSIRLQRGLFWSAVGARLSQIAVTRWLFAPNK
jgi:hypothetical protein